MPFQSKRYTRGQQASASNLTALGGEVERLGKVTVEGAEFYSDASGQHFRIHRPSATIWARINDKQGTGDNATAHGWVQVVPVGVDEDGAYQFVDLADGDEGDATLTPMLNPAYGPNGQIFDEDTVVELSKAYASVDVGTGKVVQTWLIGSGGGSSSEDLDTVVRVSSTTPVGTGKYSGYKQIYNSTTSTWSDGEALTVVDINA